MKILSIVIPLYNSLNYIDCLIENIEKQTLDKKKFEVIFVDDCSTDNIVSYFQERKKNEKIEYTFYSLDSKGGAGGARNLGINVSVGKYIMFLDADDSFTNDFFEKMLMHIVNYDLDIVVCNFFMDGKSNKLDKYLVDKKTRLLQPPAPWNKIFRKSFIVNTGIVFQENLKHQDLGTITKWLYKTEKIGYINHELYDYHSDNQGSITKTTSGFNKDIYIILDDLFLFFSSEKREDLYEAIMNRHLYSRYQLYSRCQFHEGVKYSRFLNTYIRQKSTNSKTFTFSNTNNYKHTIMHSMSKYTKGYFPVIVFKIINLFKNKK